MPKIKYKARRDIPDAVRTLKTLDRHEIIRHILNKYNHKVTVSSINMWFIRHKDIYEELQNELKSTLKSIEAEVESTLFEKGIFYYIGYDGRIYSDVPIIDDYIRGKKRKQTVKSKTLKGYIIHLREFCLGIRPHINPETQKKYRKEEWEEQKKRWKREEVPDEDIVKGIDLKKHGWVIRHPERITIDDVNEYLDLMIEHYPNVDNSGIRLALRNFFKYHDIKGVDQIRGRKHRSAGKYADL